MTNQSEMEEYFVIVTYHPMKYYGGGRSDHAATIFGTCLATDPDAAADAIAKKLSVGDYEGIVSRRVALTAIMETV